MKKCLPNAYLATLTMALAVSVSVTQSHILHRFIIAKRNAKHFCSSDVCVLYYLAFALRLFANYRCYGYVRCFEFSTYILLYTPSRRRLPLNCTQFECTYFTHLYADFCTQFFVRKIPVCLYAVRSTHVRRLPTPSDETHIGTLRYAEVMKCL